MKEIEKILKESKKCEENSPARKTAMLEFLREFVTNNGQVKSAELLGVSRVNLSKILSGKKGVGEVFLNGLVEKILKNDEKK